MKNNLIVENINNFRRVKLYGNTKQEALEQAPFEIIGDATIAYSKYYKETGNDPSNYKLLQFMIKYLSDKKCPEGFGYSITVVPAIENKKRKPYKIKNIKNKNGWRKYKTIYQIIDINTNEILANIDGDKNDAMNAIKELYTKKNYTGDCKCVYTKQVISGEPKAFSVSYTPSSGTQKGCYIAFGFEVL